MRTVIVGAVLGMTLMLGGTAVAGGCGGWTSPSEARVGEAVSVATDHHAGFGGTVVDVRLGDTIVGQGPVTDNPLQGSFAVTFAVPNGTPVGPTTIAIRTRVSGQFGPPICDWQVRSFEVLSSFVIGGTTTSGPSTTVVAPSTPSTTAPSAPTQASSALVTTSTAGPATTAMGSEAATSSSPPPLAAPTGDDGGGASVVLYVLLGAVGGVGLFAGGMWLQRRMSAGGSST